MQHEITVGFHVLHVTLSSQESWNLVVGQSEPRSKQDAVAEVQAMAETLPTSGSSSDVRDL